MLKVTIVRSMWHRGMEDKGSGLMVPNGKMCCMGFAAVAAGVPKEKLACTSMATIGYISELPERRGVTIPESLTGLVLEVRSKFGGSKYVNNAISNLLVAINDGANPDEAKIIETGKQANILFTFVD